MDPRVLVAELQRQFKTGDGDTGWEMANLRRDIRDLKSEQLRLLEQRQKDYIDQDLLELQTGPVKALCDEKGRALRCWRRSSSDWRTMRPIWNAASSNGAGSCPGSWRI